MEHLTERLARRFLFGRATRDEARIVVRHLLTQCPRCATLARRIPTEEVCASEGYRTSQLMEPGSSAFIARERYSPSWPAQPASGSAPFFPLLCVRLPEPEGLSMKHISPEAIEDFLACRFSREESRAFVRHLLRCPARLALTSAKTSAAFTCPGRESLRRPAPGPASYSSAFRRAIERVAEVLSLDSQGNGIRPRTLLE
jgi:hypothetical protein